MAGTSGCSREFEVLKLSDTSCAMGGSDESEYLTAPARAADHGTTALSFVSARDESIVEREKSGECSTETVSVEEQIEKSKPHWSLLADHSGAEGEEVAEVSNVEEFAALQRHSTWGCFFQTFGYRIPKGRYKSMGSLEVGEKFAEGGQAELFHAHVTWWRPEDNEEDLKKGTEYVVKVFKKGTFLKHLKSQLPLGLLQMRAERIENWKSPTPKRLLRCSCKVYRGILLKNGRFAFLMRKEHMDLHSLIERHMKLRSALNGGPFSKKDTTLMLYDVALGVGWLHNHNIIHRDLKASNVLVREHNNKGWPKWNCLVADYECSIGVVGTGFFRAPEILQTCKDGKISERPEVFSRAADIYSYGMTCYEILTGKLPFEGHPLSPKLLIDLVINQHLRPEVPEHVEDWTKELLNRCWQFDPIARPSIEEILDLLLANSTAVRRAEDFLKKKYGENFRPWQHAGISNS